MPWKPVANDKVRLVWEHPTTEETITTSPSELYDVGIPYDPDADEEYTYLRMEVEYEG